MGMSDVTLVFGTGATRAGTSWLHKYLSSHPECHMRRQKELHYFSSLETGSFSWRLQALEERELRLLKRHDKAEYDDQARIRAELNDTLEWHAFYKKRVADHNGYLGYLKNGITTEHVVGEITPAYSMLSAETFRDMASLAPTTLFIYIMRDPLERLWSNARMAARRAARFGGSLEDHAKDILEAFLDGDHQGLQKRTDYEKSLTNMTASISRDSILFLFFETMFTDETVNRIADFLNISHKSGQFSQVAHPGSDVDIDPDQRRRALDQLKPQYDFVRNFFQGAVPSAWNANKAEV